MSVLPLIMKNEVIYRWCLEEGFFATKWISDPCSQRGGVEPTKSMVTGWLVVTTSSVSGCENAEEHSHKLCRHTLSITLSKNRLASLA